MTNKPIKVILLCCLFILLFGTSVFAFQDTKGDKSESQIDALARDGVVNGVGADKFDPLGKLTLAQGVSMIVKGFELNIDSLRFIKAPQASDYFTNVPNDAWYADSFIIAGHNGLDLPRDANPNQLLTKEHFSHLLYQGMTAKADFMVPAIYMIMADEKQVNPAYMNSVQTLLILKITALDAEKKFNPGSELTRSDAAALLYNALDFAKKHPSSDPKAGTGIPKNTNPSGEPGSSSDSSSSSSSGSGSSSDSVSSPAQPSSGTATPDPSSVVSMTADKVTDSVDQITLSWGSKPNSGYRITINSIIFQDNGEAVIQYSLHYPEQGKMYAEVITEPKAQTYISSKYKAILQPIE